MTRKLISKARIKNSNNKKPKKIQENIEENLVRVLMYLSRSKSKIDKTRNSNPKLELGESFRRERERSDDEMEKSSRLLKGGKRKTKWQIYRFKCSKCNALVVTLRV